MIIEKNDNHYYYIMGWEEDNKLNAPIYKKRFNIYDDANNYYNEILPKCNYVEFFEYIDGKRKYIKTSDDTKQECLDYVENFEKFTGISLRKMDSLFGESYRVISGHHHNYIKKKVEKYNKANNTHLSCYNDYTKDETVIKF